MCACCHETEALLLLLLLWRRLLHVKVRRQVQRSLRRGRRRGRRQRNPRHVGEGRAVSVRHAVAACILERAREPAEQGRLRLAAVAGRGDTATWGCRRAVSPPLLLLLLLLLLNQKALLKNVVASRLRDAVEAHV
jgi:hypothetical protein